MVSVVAASGSDPEPGAPLLEAPRVGDVGVERGLEVDEHEAHLAHLTPEVLAGVRVPELVNQDDDTGRHPQHHDVRQRDRVERVGRGERGAEVTPPRPEQDDVEEKRGDRREDEGAAEHPVEVRERARQQRIGIAERPAHAQQLAAEERGTPPLVPFGAQALDLQRRALLPRALEKSGIRHRTCEALDDRRGDPQTLLRQHLGDLGRRALSVEGAENAHLGRAEPEILPGGEVLHDEARLAAVDLLDDRDVGAQTGRARAGGHAISAAAARAARRSPVR